MERTRDNIMGCPSAQSFTEATLSSLKNCSMHLLWNLRMGNHSVHFFMSSSIVGTIFERYRSSALTLVLRMTPSTVDRAMSAPEILTGKMLL